MKKISFLLLVFCILISAFGFSVSADTDYSNFSIPPMPSCSSDYDYYYLNVQNDGIVALILSSSPLDYFGYSKTVVGGRNIKFYYTDLTTKNRWWINTNISELSVDGDLTNLYIDFDKSVFKYSNYDIQYYNSTSTFNYNNWSAIDNHIDYQYHYEGTENISIQPDIWHVSYLPSFPNEYFDFKYHCISYDNVNDVYYLYISNFPMEYLDTHSYLLTYGYTDNFRDYTQCFKFDNKLVDKYWSNSGYIYAVGLNSKFNVFYVDYDIFSGVTHGIAIYASHNDFILVTIAVAKFQHTFISYSYLLLPIGISILILILLFKLIKRLFKTKIRNKPKMSKTARNLSCKGGVNLWLKLKK